MSDEKSAVCPCCDGSGYENSECETCGRDGYVDDPSDGGTMTCPDCQGSSDYGCENGCEEGYFYWYSPPLHTLKFWRTHAYQCR